MPAFGLAYLFREDELFTIYDVKREQKYHVYLTADEQSRVIQSLIRLKNELIEQGRYIDVVDDVLCKVVSAKKKRNFFI